VADEQVPSDTDEKQAPAREVRLANREDLPPADTTPREDNPRGYKFLDDVTLSLTADLGSTDITIRDVLAIEPGTVIELDKLAGEMIDVCVQGNYLGKAEVMVIADSLGIRLTEIGSRQQEGDEKETVDPSDTG